MPSTRVLARFFERATTQRNVTIVVAILVAVPTAYAFRSAVPGGDSAADFLLLLTLAVAVPTAYDERWPRYDQTSTAVAWILGACLVATVAFAGLYLLGTAVVGLSPLFASVAAFLVTDLGGLALLSTRGPD